MKSPSQKLSIIVQAEAKDLVFLTKGYLDLKRTMNAIVVNIVVYVIKVLSVKSVE